MRLVSAKEVGKYEAHYEQRQKRRENAPYHAEIGAFIFLFEITLYKLGEQKFVFSDFFNAFNHEIFLD